MSSNDGMDLKQYVSQTISDIIDGIDEVASKNKNRYSAGDLLGESLYGNQRSQYYNVREESTTDRKGS
ncbi:MAG: hypothetical protein LBM09_00420 [Candidatus Nomurabacteria bacterium]|jgi:hypothetical protein|nr:hypothetical protein [Candidatus Nomurabacteria bacterium]